MTTSMQNHIGASHDPLASISPTAPSASIPLKVGIIGGGVAGSTIAIRLAALGVQTYLFETKASLIDGPPMCHLHAGGNLYREIPDADCVALLKQSIDMLRMYPHSIDVRPTVIAIPKRDDGNPNDLLSRLQLLTAEYQAMITADPANKVLGEPEEYYRLYDRQRLEQLMASETLTPKSMDQWVAAAARQLDLNKLKFPIVAVNEYGWNIFRLAASAQTALNYYPNAHLLLNTQVVDVTEVASTAQVQVAHNRSDQDEPKTAVDEITHRNARWEIHYHKLEHCDQHSSDHPLDNTEPNQQHSIQVDYLINACGFRTGIIDNMLGVPAQRMVEFKASYVTHWPQPNTDTYESDAIDNLAHCIGSSSHTHLPEIIIHGKRGTPHGMVQLTPYPEGYYQIHSMNKAVTLFNDGLVATTDNDAQPELEPKYLDFIDEGWNPNTLHKRSQRAIDQVSEFVPQFATAKPTENALYGGQQIPGDNDTLRVADVSLYPELAYARAENVKASSALEASDDIVAQLIAQGLIQPQPECELARQQHHWSYLAPTQKQDIDRLALKFAKMRAFPPAMSGVVTPLSP